MVSKHNIYIQHSNIQQNEFVIGNGTGERAGGECIDAE